MKISKKGVDFLLLFLPGAVILTTAYFSKSLWGDEILSIDFSAGTFDDLFHQLAQDYHPPLYFLLLKYWMLFFGSGELALRIFQCFQLVLLFYSVLVLFRLSFPNSRFHPAFFLFLLSAELWLFAPMIRYYTLAAVMAVSATVFLLLWLERESKRYLILLGVLYTVLLYTDYPTSLIIIPHGLYVAFSQRRFLLRYSVVVIAAGALFLPWAIVVITQIGHLASSSQVADFNSSVFSIFLKIGFSFYAFLLGETLLPIEPLAVL